MLPTREKAEELLIEAEKCNPGPWGNHSRVTARCAEKIAKACGDLDPDKAYITGLLHDIGRKFGKRHLGHVSDGYSYMMSLGYEEAARICLTHSFNTDTLDGYIGNFDTTEEELKLIQSALETIVMDEYDRLIQLCDSIAGADGVLDMEERMLDVKHRYGSYPQKKWDNNLDLKRHFEKKMGKNLYVVVNKENLEDIVLLYDGCCIYEIVILNYFLKCTESKLLFCFVDRQTVRAVEGYSINCDMAIDEINLSNVRSFIVPGGDISNISCQNVYDTLRKLSDQRTIIAGICAGVDILDKAGILKDISSTHSSEFDCVRDKNIITARANAYVDFAIETGKALEIFEDEADLQETIEFWKNHKKID